VSIWDQADPDVLGEPFSALTLPLGDDFEGPVTATLVRSPAAAEPRGSVLYIAGYNDYFFQRHLAEFYNGRGYDFYGLDLRKAGRSCHPGQTRNLCRHLDDYFPEIDRAVEIIRTEGGPGGSGPLLLNGHSLGGLTASLWLSRQPGQVDGLFLNGPFLTSGIPLALQAVLNPMARVIASRRPAAAFPGRTAGIYARGLHSDNGGEWTFDQRWKSTTGTQPRMGWLAGVHEGQRRVRHGLGIDVPVLVLFAEKSSKGVLGDITRRSDIVLMVDANAALAARLGSDVTCQRIPDAIHDVLLSRPDVRKRAFGVIGSWMDSRLTAGLDAQPG
jgi:alpha-beta hydrolase superfamily lysophospholipase